jgi:septal ring factor EnvC (AmiA/AmiB activator)
MFHRADARLRAWLAARASAGPRAPRQVAAEIDRLGALLRAREQQHAVEQEARLAAIEELRSALAANERERVQILEGTRAASARLARVERDVESLRHELAASEADREARLRYIRELEATLERWQVEAERWRDLLPRIRVRPPRRGALAARLRRLFGGRPTEPD